MAEIRQVETPEQIAAVATLARTIWTAHYVSIIGQAQVDYMLDKFQSEQAIRAQMAKEYEYYLLIENEENAGYMAVVPAPETNMLMISKLYVSETVRGRGYGRKLLAFAENICRGKGFSAVWLTVNKNNAKSIDWYLRSGFTNAGAITMDIGSGFVMDDYRMEKTVI